MEDPVPWGYLIRKKQTEGELKKSEVSFPSLELTFPPCCIRNYGFGALICEPDTGDVTSQVSMKKL
jgi:hypothetical protein